MSEQNNEANLHVKDWTGSLDDEWQLENKNGAYHIENGFLHLSQARTDDELRLRLSDSHILNWDRPFAIEIDLRFHSVGYVDNGTEEHSQFVMRIGDGKGVGTQITILGDRYMVDVNRAPLQYIIFRSLDEKWHHWRFELDPVKKQIRMFRDGDYHNLFALKGSDEVGLSFHIIGTDAVPTTIDIGELKIQPIPVENQQAVTIPKLMDNVAPGEWPSFRRDRSNTAVSPLVGNFQKSEPEVAWSYHLGGWMSDIYTADLTGDGKDEILISFSGNLSAYRQSGERLWTQRLGHPTIYGVYDLDQNGRLELAIIAGTPQTVHILDAVSGELLFVCDYDRDYPLTGLRVLKLDPNRSGLQMVTWSHHEEGFCLGFEKGVEQAEVIWTYNYEHFNFTPEICFADMDGDGLLEMVLATYCHFFVYDGQNGNIKMQLAAPTGRNYGLLIAEDIDHDGMPDIVMLAEQLREHVAVVKNHDGEKMEMAWDHFYEQDYPVDLKSLRTLPNSVRDWDGDGHVEILYCLFDETGANTWQTLLVDALSGKIKKTINNQYLLSCDSMPNGEPILILCEMDRRGDQALVSTGSVAFKEASASGKIRLVRLDRDDEQVLFEFSTGKMLLDNTWYNFPDNQWAMYRSLRAPLRLLEEKGYYFLETSGVDEACIKYYAWQSNDTLVLDWECLLSASLPKGNILDIIRSHDQKRVILFGGLDAQLHLLDDCGKSMQKLPAGGVTGYAVVGDLAKGRRVLIPDAHRQLNCVQVRDEQPVLEWKISNCWEQRFAYVVQGQAMPMIFDWDQDGNKEILSGQLPDKVVIADHNGEISWSARLPFRPTFWNFGNFSGGNTFDLFTAFSDGFYGGGSCVFHGDSGKQLWVSKTEAFSSAVADFDGDQRDDILLRDLFWRHVFDGQSGRDIFPVTQWAGYHIPTLVDHPEKNNGVEVVFTAGNYGLTAEKLAGDQVWWRPFMAHWVPGVVADVDGDGFLEIGAMTWGQVFNWPAPFDEVPGLGRAFACLNTGTGDVKWTYDVKSAISGVVAADVDGDGLLEFVFGTADGRLMALRGGEVEDRLVFSVQLPAAVGMPVICDPAGGERMHILVGCADGNLYALR